MGYIIGLFSRFREDEDFCLKVKEAFNCFLGNDISSRTYYESRLIPIYKHDLNIADLFTLTDLKYLLSVKICECVIEPNISSKSYYKFEVINKFE